MSNPVQSGPYIIDSEGIALVIAGQRIPVQPHVVLDAGGNVVDPTTARGTAANPVQYSNVAGQQFAKVSVTGKTGHAAAGLFAWQAPADVLVTKVVVNVRTIATGAAVADAGSTATSAGTASDNLLDGIDLHTLGLKGIADQAGANGKAQQFLAQGTWVTAGAEALVDVDGFVGDFFIFYVNA